MIFQSFRVAWLAKLSVSLRLRHRQAHNQVKHFSFKAFQVSITHSFCLMLTRGPTMSSTQSRASSNPAFGDKVWERVSQSRHADGSGSQSFAATEGTATIQGTTNKTAFLLFCLLLTSAASWIYAPQLLGSGILFPVVIVTAIVQLVMTFMIVRNPTRAKNFGIAYALIEGVVLGAISYIFEMRYPGIAIQAMVGTAGVVVGMLVLYKTKLIEVTENFKLIVAAATMGIALLYIVSLVMSAFGSPIGFLHEGSPMGIAFSVFVIGIAAFNLAIDFDFVEKCEAQKAPKYMEWYGAFGLLITIIWIYIEILRLLSKLNSRK
jgi:uncharacterized YccA/Bax inhibitor family protein